MASASAGDYKDTLVEALRCFQCCKDKDVQEFLNNKAINFETRGWATTYLLLSQEAFENGEFKEDIKPEQILLSILTFTFSYFINHK